MMRTVDIRRQRGGKREKMVGTDKALAIVFAIFFFLFSLTASGCLMYISPMLGKIFRLGLDSLSKRERDDLEYFGIFSILLYIFCLGFALMEIDLFRRFRIFNRFSVWAGYWHGYQPLPESVD